MRTLDGVTATRINAVSGWTEEVRSATSFTGSARAAARLRTPNTHQMFGLNTDPTLDVSYSSLDFAWYVTDANLAQIYESGVAVTMPSGAIPTTVNDLLEIVYADMAISYRFNGVAIRQVSVAAGLTFFFDSSLYTPTGGWKDIQFGPSETPAIVTFIPTAGVSIAGKPQRASAAAANIVSHTKVEITDAEGLWRDLSSAIQGKDWLNSGSIEESADGNSQRFSLNLRRDHVGFQMLANSEFAGGSLAGYTIYDNLASGTIALSAEADADAPSGYRMKIHHSAGTAAAPGHGGFYRGIGVDDGTYHVNTYHRGAKIIWRILAFIPIGCDLQYTSNTYGDQSSFRYLTSTAGAGAWREYLVEQIIGTTGSFSTIGFFYIQGGTRPFDWYVRLLTATDMTTTLMTSLAPLRTESSANRKASDHTYAPTVHLNRKWRVRTATLPLGVDPLAADYEEVGTGFIDHVHVNDEPAEVNIDGRDAGAILLDAFVRTKRTYGTVGAGTEMATILQQIVDDNAADNGYSGITVVSAGGPTGFLMNPFEIDVGPLMPQLNDVAGKDGRILRMRYDAADAMQMMLWKPNRTATVPDFTLAPDEYTGIPLNDLDIFGVKNVVKIRFWDSASGTIHEVVSPTPETSASITEFRKRYMEIDLSANGQVNSDAKALAYADIIRLDLQTPALEQMIESYGLWWVQLGDYIKTAANKTHYDQDQYGGVMGFTHRFGAGTWKTSIKLKGKPAGRYATWLRLATGAPDQGQIGPTLVVNAVEDTNNYIIAWDGDNVLLSIDGGTYSIPPASPITATRNAIGGFAKVYTFNAYKNGQEVTQTVVVSPKRATNPPTADLQQLAESQTSMTHRLTGTVGAGAAGPLQYRARIDFNGATGTWTSWAAFPSGGGTYIDIVTGKAVFYPKVLLAQTRDANAVESAIVTADIMGTFSSHKPITGTIDPVVPMYGGYVPFEYGGDSADGIVPTTVKDFIRQDQIDLGAGDHRVIAIKRGGVNAEPTTNVFKIGSDTTDSVLPTAIKGFIHQSYVSGVLQPLALLRASAFENSENLFKRGSNDATDVVTTTTRTFVDPQAASQVDASGRIVGVYRLGVYEPVNNLVKFGDSLGAMTMSSLTLNGLVAAQLTLSGSPTVGLQVMLGTSSVIGTVGTKYSSGDAFLAHNAYQTSYSTDSWAQSLGSARSVMIELGPTGLGLYVAAIGKAVGTNAAFWGSPIFTISETGVISGVSLGLSGAITGTTGVTTSGHFIGPANKGVITGNSFFGQQGGGYGEVGYNNNDGTGTTKYLVTDTASRIRFNSGGFSFQTAPSGSAGAAITFTERMLLTSTGLTVNVSMGVPYIAVGVATNNGYIYFGTDQAYYIQRADGTWGTGSMFTNGRYRSGGSMNADQQLRATGWFQSGDSAGLGFEAGVSAGQVYVYSYNRTSAAYGVMNLGASAFNFNANLNAPDFVLT